MMRGKPAVLAVVFDFDETLVPDSTSKVLQSRGVDPHEFWTGHVRRRLERVHGTMRWWLPRGRSPFMRLPSRRSGEVLARTHAVIGFE